MKSVLVRRSILIIRVSFFAICLVMANILKHGVQLNPINILILVVCFIYKEFSLAKCGCLVKYLGKANDVLLHSILSKLECCVRRVFFSAKCTVLI